MLSASIILILLVLLIFGTALSIKSAAENRLMLIRYKRDYWRNSTSTPVQQNNVYKYWTDFWRSKYRERYLIAELLGLVYSFLFGAILPFKESLE